MPTFTKNCLGETLAGNAVVHRESVPVVVSATDAVTIVKGSRPFAESQQAAAANMKRAAGRRRRG
jgi:hypothetical protein